MFDTLQHIVANFSFVQGITVIGLLVLCAVFFRTILVLFLAVCVAFAVYQIRIASVSVDTLQTQVVQQAR